eukprot:TRINITY_DN29_c0_g1_i1.p1 TRINITY_DN29_c0_g1~~TRINITY_DN29_c0_g1_i1.p1  ORF type:complete len:358 (+),score=128.90 TRINITY_DN29_c0_g1_i1:44-1117(+)
MSGGGPKQRKQQYLVRATSFFEKYSTILIVGADNVTSKQLSTIRKRLRGEAVILMGKNTLMRKAIRDLVEKKPEHKKLLRILPKIVGNCGLVFTEKTIKNIRTTLESEKKPAEAKAGAISPVDVIIPAGPTSLDPQQTQFMQALNIETKISRMKIEITSPVNLLNKGDRVSPSQAELLRKLNLKPFEYGLVTKAIYEDGDCYDSYLLDLSDEDVLGKFSRALGSVTALSLKIGYPNLLWFNNLVFALKSKIKEFNALSLALNIPTQATIPSMLFSGYKDLSALAVAIGQFPKIGKHESLASNYKKFQENPDAFKAAAAPAAAPAPAKTEKKEAAKPAKEEKKEDSDQGGDMDLGGLF